MEQNICPKTWLAESILTTLFCCLPFGVVGIVYAAQVTSLFSQGNYAAAQETSRKAGMWTKISFFVGLGVIVIYLLMTLFLGFSWFDAYGVN